MLDKITLDQIMAKQDLESQAKFHLLLGGFVLLILVFIIVFQVRQDRNEKEKTRQLREMDLIKERIAIQSVSVEEIRQEILLSREKIEAYLGKPLGDSSWSILNVIFENPSISNRNIA